MTKSRRKRIKKIRKTKIFSLFQSNLSHFQFSSATTNSTAFHDTKIQFFYIKIFFFFFFLSPSLQQTQTRERFFSPTHTLKISWSSIKKSTQKEKKKLTREWNEKKVFNEKKILEENFLKIFLLLELKFLDFFQPFGISGGVWMKIWRGWKKFFECVWNF